MKNEYKYKLPKGDNSPVEHISSNNSLIIIGANGSGKSKLGAWIEQHDLENTHRVGAQRSLSFGEYIQLKSYEQAENLLQYGVESIDGRNAHQKSKQARWNYGKTTTTLLNDYEFVLSALIARKNNENDIFIKDCKEREAQKQQYNKVPETVIDTLKRIWKNVFPQREIDFPDSKVTAMFNQSSYKGSEMSDGERVGLYLIAQCLCVPENKTIIIDEPEIHLHRSIMNRLWTELEKERQDCLFIYITHDTQFAANHRQAKKIWVKSYDGANWDLEEIQDSDLPEQLLLDILGNRKKVLFVEGDANSYDTKLYKEIYKDYYVIPCGGCSSVITRTKAMRNTPQLHHLECYGLIDRDFRNDAEINNLKKDNVFVIDVAEIENLLLVEELLNVVSGILAKSAAVDKVKKYVMDDRFTKEINNQILESTVAELKYQLSVIDIPRNDESAAKQKLDGLSTLIDFNKTKSEQEKKYSDILATKNYKQVLSVFNRKDVVSSIGCFFELPNKGYCDFIIRQLQGEKAKDIIATITPYLPKEIPV